MSLFSSKPKLNIDECCSQFYNLNIFGNGNTGIDAWSLFLSQIIKSISEVAPPFVFVNADILNQEMIALRMETFALAWAEKFKKEKYTYPHSYSTWEYLSEHERIDIWDIMGEYNKAISDSVYRNEKGEQYSGATGRAIFTWNNQMRASMFKEWAKNHPNDEIQTKCVARALNRFGASVKQKDCLVVKLLTNKLIERLGNDFDFNSEAFLRLSAVILGFCQGAEGYLKGVDVQVKA